MAKQLLADILREGTASADFRKAKLEMMKLIRSFSKVRHIIMFNPDDQTVEMLRNEGLSVERTKITEYVQFKVSW